MSCRVSAVNQNSSVWAIESDREWNAAWMPTSPGCERH